jgi:hypothetical protein
MSLAQRLSAALFCSTLVWITGCVGPMACGPNGACGPLAFGHPCEGCSDCEGCGELYIDPWINEPADACDPCDKCGNYNGQSCGKCRSVFEGVGSMWGYRCDGGGDEGCETCSGGCGALNSCGASCGGCDSCSDSCGGCESGCASCEGGLVEMGSEPHAHDIVEATESFTPQRTRKIFNPRSSVSNKASKPSAVISRRTGNGSDQAISIVR